MKLIVLFALFSLNVYSQVELLYSVEVDPFVELERVLGQTNLSSKSNISCTPVDDFDYRKTRRGNGGDERILPTCDWKKLCEPIKENLGKPYAYLSTSGEALPTRTMLAEEYEMFNCIRSKQAPVFEDVDNKVFFEYLNKLSVEERKIDYLNNEDLNSLLNLAKQRLPNAPESELVKIIRNEIKAKRDFEFRREVALNGFLKLPFERQVSYLTNPNLLGSIDLTKLPNELKSKLETEYNRLNEKNYELFLEVKRDMIQVLQKRYSKDDPSYKEVMRRVETLGYIAPKFDEIGKGSECRYMNAFYKSSEHSVQMCQQFFNLPKETIATVMAHEIAHSFDPCMLSRPMLEFEGDNPLSDEVMDHLGSGPNNYSLDFLGLTDYGIMPRTGQISKRSSGYTYKESIFSEEIQCLERFDTANIRVNPSNYVLSSLKDQRDQTNQRDYELYGFEGTGSEFYDKLLSDQNVTDKYRHCVVNANSVPESGEVFSDLLASEVLERRLRRYDLTDQREKAFEGMGYFILGACTEDENDHSDLRRSLYSKCPENRPTEKSLWDKIVATVRCEHKHAHQSSEDRLKDIFLRNPGIAKTFNCKADGKYCGK